MRVILSVLAIASLAACGADGPPEAPASKAQSATGITLSGCAVIGLSYGTDGAERPDC